MIQVIFTRSAFAAHVSDMTRSGLSSRKPSNSKDITLASKERADVLQRQLGMNAFHGEPEKEVHCGQGVTSSLFFTLYF